MMNASLGHPTQRDREIEKKLERERVRKLKREKRFLPGGVR